MSLDQLTNTARPVERILPVVGCDLDDVLADFMDKFIEMAKDRYGVPTDDRLPIDWAWSNMGWTKEQEASLWQQLHDTPDFWTTLKVLKGVDRELVRTLSDNTSLYFPTARAQAIGTLSTRDQCARWLLNEFNLPFPTVIVSNEKGPLAAALKYDYFIDDRPKNCLEVKAARPQCKVFMSDACHNQKDDLSQYGIPRVSGFNEFAGIVLKGE